jgi:hypothetical protein
MLHAYELVFYPQTHATQLDMHLPPMEEAMLPYISGCCFQEGRNNHWVQDFGQDIEAQIHFPFGDNADPVHDRAQDENSDICGLQNDAEVNVRREEPQDVGMPKLPAELVDGMK